MARWFNAINELGGANFGHEVYPGYPGAVIADGKLKQMTWGFPLVMRSKKTGQPLKPKPVNNARTDKLDGYFWRYSFEERRCLIPLTAWAEAQGPKGGKTRTWLSLPNDEIFAVAGVWRKTDEWGLAYSMVMTGSAGPAAEVHSRMPVILGEQEKEEWLHASPNDARSLCKPYEGELVIDPTSEKWIGG